LDIVISKCMTTLLVFPLPCIFHEAVKYDLIRPLNNCASYEHTNKRVRTHTHTRARAHTHIHTLLTEFKQKYFDEMLPGSKDNIC
jgi:hypothetical protein